MIVNNKRKFTEPVLNRNCVITNKDVYNYIKQKNIKLKNFFLMKYYSNTNFDIDCYASKSEIKYLGLLEEEIGLITCLLLMRLVLLKEI